MIYKKIIFSFLTILILITLIVIVAYSRRETIFIDNGVEEIKLRVEVADSLKKMEKGLMFRKSLDENGGMFFAFENEGQYTFWMKNTLIPLDIIFISPDFNIVEIVYAEPCEEDLCKGYKNAKSAKYILEVNGDFTTENDIKVGSKVIIKEEVIKKMMRGLSKG